MAEISAAMVKQLREKTGAGIMDCKEALAECDADMDKAVEFLRKKGRNRFRRKNRRFSGTGEESGHAYRRFEPFGDPGGRRSRGSA
jgi:elongation factor Ts